MSIKIRRELLPLNRFMSLEASLDVREADDQGSEIAIRVDWNGANGTLGSFAVRNTSAVWEPCGNLNPSLSPNDLILLRPDIDIGLFKVAIERGPNHPAVPFHAWAVPIEWVIEPDQLPGYQSGALSPVRNEHYTYATAAQNVNGVSALEGGGHRLTLTLSSQRDYELWVKLRHPTDASRWCIQDPIVRQEEPPGTNVAAELAYKERERSADVAQP